MAHRRDPADFTSAEANQLIRRRDDRISGASLGVSFMGNVSSPSNRARMDVLVGDGKRISGASASNSLGVPFMGNVSSPSKQARMGGLVADGEEAQHHRVPCRHESFVPSGSPVSMPYLCLRSGLCCW
jgi:hypothetical protein